MEFVAQGRAVRAIYRQLQLLHQDSDDLIAGRIVRQFYRNTLVFGGIVNGNIDVRHVNVLVRLLGLIGARNRVDCLMERVSIQKFRELLMPGLVRRTRLVTDWTVGLFFARASPELGQLGHPPTLAEDEHSPSGVADRA